MITRSTRTTGLNYHINPTVYLLWLDGIDMRSLPLIQRKSALRDLIEGMSLERLGYVDYVVEQGEQESRLRLAAQEAITRSIMHLKHQSGNLETTT